MAIRNIILDLCGPVITIDLDLMNAKFRSYGVKYDDAYQRLYATGLTKRFEAGSIGKREFFDEVRSVLECRMDDSAIEETWNTLIAGFPRRRVESIKELSGKYRLFLLSNSDEVNAQYFRDYLNRESGFDILGECFEKTYFSCEVGDRKPSAALFGMIVEENGLQREETLVIDDCKKHCEGAGLAGLKSRWLRSGEDICELNIETL